ncbi:MAG: T9SS type A sorting domain-containing protein, partial [Bacteroidota bacterium]
LQRNGTQLTVGKPMPLSTAKGMNRSPQLVKLDGTRMLAVWTNDSDGVDTTFDARILTSLWDGSSWSAPAEVVRAGNRETFARTTFAANSHYAVLGWTSTKRDTNGIFLSGMDVRVWDIANAQWVNASEYTVRDSTAYIQNPAVSTGEDGKVIVSYQWVPRSDSVAVSEGRRALLLRSVNDPSGTWREVPGLGMLSDTNAYVWTARTALDAGDNYYSLTEEQQRDATTKPIAGIRFGSPELGLVLRRVHIGSDLSINDVDEPEAPSGIPLTHHEDVVSTIQISPNPTRGDFLITYSINHGAFVTIQLVDATGGSVGSVLSENLEVGTYQTHVSTAELASGVYWVVVRSGPDLQRLAIRVIK